jgi:hypothetical protein
VTAMLILVSGAAGLLLVVLLHAQRQPKREKRTATDLEALGELTRSHVTYLPVIRQAMSVQDFAFLESRAQGRAVRRTHKERQQIAILYLADLRADFQQLLRLARIIAVMSPEVAASHEFERLRLTVHFTLRYGLVLAGLHLGWLLMPQLSRLSDMVSELAYRMESCMKELGERAVVAMELASTLNRRHLDAA